MSNLLKTAIPIVPTNSGRIIPSQGQQIPLKAIKQRPDNAVEYKLRVPKNLVKRYSIMKLRSPRPINVDQIKDVYMARKSGLTEEDDGSKGPSFGAGSEYGKDRKEEAKKRKRGQLPKGAKAEDFPFTLQLGGKSGRCFTGRKEGAILDNSSYYILTQCADHTFEAIPVQAWYTFTPDVSYHTLSADEVEHEFSKREKTINYYNLMAKKRLEALDEKEESEGIKMSEKVSAKHGADLMIHDDEDEDEDEFEDVSDEGDTKEKKKSSQGKNKKGKKNMYHGKTKKQKAKDSDVDEDSDEEEELENIESKEFDYLSESSSDDEMVALEDEPEPEKTNIKSKAKDDLSAAVLSDSSSSEEETNELTEEGKELKELMKKQKGNDNSSSEEDDDDDEDIDNNDKYSKSTLFLQGKDKKKKGRSGSNSGSASSSRSCTPTSQLDNSSNQGSQASKKGKLEHRKRPHSRGPIGEPSQAKKPRQADGDFDGSKTATSDKTGTPPSKRIKTHRDSPSVTESRTPTPSSELCITEEAIIRYLSHKPMTTTDLVRKFKTKRTGLSKEQTVKTIAAILKKLGPDKKTVDNKLYLSIKPKKTW